MSNSQDLKIRSATADDADAIAALHTASWRAHYRGALSDAYLDGPVEEERRSVWRERLAHPRADRITLVADEAGALIGFVHVMLNHDRQFGSLIDNLHVAVDRKGAGLGRRLMLEAGQALLFALPQRPVHLFVLLSNTAAQAFYDRVGGVPTEPERKTEPDGSTVLVLRYLWASPAALIEGCESSRSVP